MVKSYKIGTFTTYYLLVVSQVHPSLMQTIIYVQLDNGCRLFSSGGVTHSADSATNKSRGL